MGRRKVKADTFRWCSLIASFAFLTAVNAQGGTNTKADSADPAKTLNTEPAYCQGKSCTEKPAFRSLMLVSTLDGKMSALNIQQEGALEWSIETGDGDLISSSISKLEVNRNGVITRLIPSLDGGLYQFDGESVQPVPFTADTLLSHSFNFNDESTIVGGKHSHTYGIDARTGQIRYMCSSAGCQQVAGSGEDRDHDEVLLVTRHSKTVRAVEMRTGVEKWNFSVGEHELSYVSQSKHHDPKQGALTDESGPGNAEDGWLDEEIDEDNTTNEEEQEEEEEEEEEEEVTVDSCAPEDEEADSSFFEFPWWSGGEDEGASGRGRGRDVELKVIVPSGMVIALAKDDPGKILWKYKFATPIANAWTLIDGALESMDLFDAKNIPALTFEQPAQEGAEILPPSPAMYIGLHQKQIYVQPSVQIVHAYEDSLQAAMFHGHLSHLTMPKVNWKPYLASAPSRTPAAIELQNPMQITWDGDTHEVNMETGLELWHAEYPYDPGYYLYYERMPTPLPVAEGAGESSSYTPDMAMLWNLKEVVAIAIFTSILLHVTIVRVFYSKATPVLPVLCGSDTAEAEQVEEVVYGEEVKAEEIVAVIKPVEFESRYLTDFDQVACLGKGGFGVVYHARNRLDDCDYAIKRIPLRNSEGARGRVGREVKALAKLDHAGIVRYYNAWFESPPPGWQEKKDEELLTGLEGGSNMESLSPDPATISEFTKMDDSMSKMSAGGVSKHRNLMKPSNFNPLNPFHEQLLSSGSEEDEGETKDGDSSDWAESYKFGGAGEDSKPGKVQTLHKSSSYGFMPHDPNADSYSWDESGSYSVEQDQQNSRGFVPVEEDSFGIDFKDDSESGSLSQGPESDHSVPFNKYSVKTHRSRARKRHQDSSCDIIFEDSGCGDHNNDAIIDVRDSTTTEQSESSEDTSQGGHASSSQSASTILSGSPPTRPGTLDIIPENSEHKAAAASVASPSGPVPKSYLYIQMQLCRKESLKDWLAGNTLNRSREQSLDIFDQIVSAVDYVHGCGLMHRDLKPSNIFFSLDGTVKIGDFGLATEECRTEGEVMTPMNRVPSKPHTNQVGTKLYMSPEQIAGKQYTNKVDIYALGLILFELFYPFATMMERGQVMQRVKRLDFPSRFRKELEEECGLVESLLSPSPDKRPTTTEILDTPMLMEVHQIRFEKRIRTNSRSRTLSTNSSHSNSASNMSGQDDTDTVQQASSPSPLAS